MMVRLPEFVDERFLTHRLRSTSLAGIVASVLALLLFLYREYHDHVIHWDLLAVGLTFVVVKLAALVWYRLND
jgi:protein-S-isoprenylcysteine O-methyltransferase Ste14